MSVGELPDSIKWRSMRQRGSASQMACSRTAQTKRAAVAEEFYPETAADRAETSTGNNPSETHGTSSTLRDKLERKAMMMGGAAA